MVKVAYDNFHEYLYTGIVFVHLRKAFDTVCHYILLFKLEPYDIPGVTYYLICSYLQDRKQFVSLNQTCSNLGNIQRGIPHGSSLGSLIYINNLSNAASCKPRLFADDTCFVEKATNPEIVQNN